MSPLLLAAATAATLALTPPASAAPAHQHGQGRLSVVVDGPALVLRLRSLTYTQALAVVDAVEQLWNQRDEHETQEEAIKAVGLVKSEP